MSGIASKLLLLNSRGRTVIKWVKHATILTALYQTVEPILVFAATCHVWKQFPQCCSHSTVQLQWHSTYDPTSILRVMQGHYGSLAADTTGHSLDLQYWHDRQPIQVPLNTPPIRNSDILDQDFSWNQIVQPVADESTESTWRRWW
ncbi:hypothetical protein BASA83_013728 [Batrachochytrium salamandrivorans]|nr:hypothetical protein BASA83_013728 [Batrachochytrium salamandrivorans]